MSFVYHYNLIYNDLKDSIENFSLDSSQVKIALKTSLSCVTAIFIANLFKLNMPFWSGITTLVIMRANVGASFSKGWMRTGGCTIGCILCIFFMGYIVQNPWLFSVFLFLGIFSAFYVGARAKHGYFWSYMLANMALIGMIAISNPYDTFPLHIAFYRSAEIFLGVIVSWFYNIVLWPNYAGNKLEDSLNKLVSDMLFFHSQLIQFYISPNDKSCNLLENYDDIKLELKKCRSMLSDVDSERFLLRKDRTDNSAILDLVENRIMSLDNLVVHFQHNKNSEFPIEYTEFLNGLAKKMDRLSRIETFKSKSFLKNVPDEEKLQLEVKKRYTAESFKKYKVIDVLFFYEFIYYFEAFCRDIKRISSNNIIRHNRNKVSKDNSDYFSIKIFNSCIDLYKPSLKNATKGGIAVLTIFWICLWLQIPGGYANMSIAIIAVLGPQLDTLASKHKGILRFFGCLTGAALGLAFLLLNTDSTYTYFIAVFCVTSVTSYIFGSKPGVAYIGLQAGLAFLICVADGFGPVVSIDSVIERLTGIFLAVMLMWLINYVIWPDNMIDKLKAKLNFVIKSLKEQVEHLQLKNDNETEDILPRINTNDVSSILKVVKETEELPEDIVNNIRMYVMNLSKISKKIYTLSNTPNEVISFFESNYEGVLRKVIDDVNSVLDKKHKKGKKQTDGNLLEQINYIILDIREKGKLRSADIRFKQDASWFILMLKRILHDVKCLREVDIDTNILLTN